MDRLHKVLANASPGLTLILCWPLSTPPPPVLNSKGPEADNGDAEICVRCVPRADACHWRPGQRAACWEKYAGG